MVFQGEETSEMFSSSSQSLGETAIALISIGSILVIFCAATIIYSLRRRKQFTASKGAPLTTDFMHSLSTWDPRQRSSAWALGSLGGPC